MYTLSLQFNLMIFETPIPRFLPRKLSQVSRHGDVHRHLETWKHETPGKDSGGEGEDGPEGHLCKSNKHVAVPRSFQASYDGFLKKCWSSLKPKVDLYNIYIYTGIDISIEIYCAFPYSLANMDDLGMSGTKEKRFCRSIFPQLKRGTHPGFQKGLPCSGCLTSKGEVPQLIWSHYVTVGFPEAATLWWFLCVVPGRLWRLPVAFLLSEDTFVAIEPGELCFAPLLFHLWSSCDVVERLWNLSVTLARSGKGRCSKKWAQVGEVSQLSRAF